MTLIKLNQHNLDHLPAGVAAPGFNRSRITPGIIHIGCGNFHRAHQSWYLQQLFRQGESGNFGILGAGVMPNDAKMREKLEQQDWMTTLIELSPEGRSAEIVGSMIGFIPVSPGNTALIHTMSDPQIKIVSLTVTEGGYYIAAGSGVDLRHPDLAHDVAHPESPGTAFGAIVAALRKRRAANQDAFTCQSCDNIQGNGDALKAVVLSLAAQSDAALAEWIESHCTFPNSMVDCIVPSTGPKEIVLAHELGIDDLAPVTHEPFRQWVMEDKFCAGRPAWDKAGAIFTDKVHDYERIKIRVLNGGGQILGPVGDLLGYEFVADALRDPLIHAFFLKCETEDVLPHVRDLPGSTREDYLNLVLARFSNKAMADTIRRFAHDGSSRMREFIVPTIRDGLASGKSIDGLALISALWRRYCTGLREDGSAIAANDPLWEVLRTRAIITQADASPWLDMINVYGELGSNTVFKKAFAKWSVILQANGVAGALQTYITQ